MNARHPLSRVVASFEPVHDRWVTFKLCGTRSRTLTSMAADRLRVSLPYK